jgi:hypothetical protein
MGSSNQNGIHTWMMDDITSRKNVWTRVKMKKCGSAGVFGGFSCITSLVNGYYTRISGDQTEVAYPSG